MAFPNVGSTQQSSSLFGAPKPPGGSIFGAPQQTQQQPAGLFGQPAQQQQQQQQPTTSIFGQPAQQQQQPGTSIFGQPAQQQQQQPATSLFGQPPQQQPTGLFGQSTQQPQQQPTGGLFGQPAGQQQPTGGLFGQPAGQQQPAGGLFGQPTTQPTGGLFGQSTSQPAGGLFGQPSQQPRQQSTFGGGSLFGTSGQQPQGSMFGSLGTTTQQQPQQQQGSLFGTSLQPQATIPAGGFGGGGLGTTSLFGGQQQQQQLSTFGPSAMPSNVPLLSKSTKFNDLPDELKRTLEGIESHIQGRIQISKDLQQRKLGDEPTKGQELIRGIHKELVNTSTLTRDDLHFTKDMKAKVEQAVQDTIVATRIVDGFKNPQGAAYLKDHAGFPLEFFTRVTDNMKQRLAWYKSTIEQIERKLSSSATQTQTPQGISATLQAQHATFLALANKTAALDAELQKIKTMYTQLWRAKTGSVRDPFNDLDRTSGGDLGMGRLDVK
ncbi:Nucleoporin nup45 [Hypsizygus marmoreus]|uniref:Nucleoporin nup45 n=1 Tax=Hypsizygus marmoreus TaxID=39966 RepID=A0A369JU83_HYPMA|nr:Nucleoporin nup45 [Hypsizygus marmoreus]